MYRGYGEKKMNDYVIYMDVSGDIEAELAAAGGLRFVPMSYSLGDDMRLCEAMETRELLHAFYDGQRGGDLTRTTQITPQQYKDLFGPLLKEGTSVLYLSLSSGLSSTFDSACLAAQQLKEKYPDAAVIPVDTLGATGGIGMMAERAMRNQKAGMSLEDNAADLEQACPKVAYWFMVEDLMYLKRGGRVSGAAAAVGSVLQLKPILRINPEGKLETMAKARGRRQGIKELIDRFEKSYDSTSPDPVYVIDADAAESSQLLTEEVLKRYPDAVIRHCGLSPIIGAHTGPGMCAVIFPIAGGR